MVTTLVFNELTCKLLQRYNSRILKVKKPFYLIFNNDITQPPNFHVAFALNLFQKNHYSVCCDICNLWIYIKCNIITKFRYRKLQNGREQRYCKKCIKQILPFSELTDSRLNRVAKENLIYSPKKIIQEKLHKK